MKKVLFVASVTKHILAFHLPFLKWFKENGCNVDVASNGKLEIPNCDNFYEISIQRNPFKKANIKAYKELKKVIQNGNYDIIHCHTPVASIFTRLAARKNRKKGTKVIYTAHGLHFFKGAPLINWLTYYPIEWICSFFTDVLITLNKEDYVTVKKHLYAKRIEYVPGVGIDTTKYYAKNTNNKQELLGVSDETIVLLSVGELNKNKNHEVILKAIQKIDNENIHYFIAGNGSNEQHLKDLAKKLRLSHRFHLLGYRTDINELLSHADIFCFPSFREGLPVSVMEAMSAGLACVVSKIRGNVDLIQDGNGGYLCNPTDSDDFAVKIEKLINYNEIKKAMGYFNRQEVEKYSLKAVMKQMTEIYKSLI